MGNERIYRVPSNSANIANNIRLYHFISLNAVTIVIEELIWKTLLLSVYEALIC